MFRMEIDSPSSSSSELNTPLLNLKDRILKRLALIDVPEESLEHPSGIITFVKRNHSRLEDIFNAILPTDDEMEAAIDTQADPNIEDLLHESMVWLQWLMFDGDPDDMLRRLALMNAGKRGVCGSVWGHNDIAYRCRTCEHDPTCAICVPCFKNGPVLDYLLLYWKSKLKSAESNHQNRPTGDDNATEPKKATEVLTSAVVGMLLEFCKCSESLLSFVSGRLCSEVDLLDVLVRTEMFLSTDVVRKLHELLLKLLSDPYFKYEFAKAFLKYYPSVVNEAVKECKDSVSKWGNLYETTQRVVEDIRFVMSHSTIPKYMTCDRRDLSRTWMKLLAFVQGINPQKRETNIHIEEENENMHLPFVLGHSIANIHALLVAGAFSTEDESVVSTINKQDIDEQDALRHAKVGRLSQESSVSSATARGTLMDCDVEAVGGNAESTSVLTSISWLMFECLRAIENWLKSANTSGGHFTLLTSRTSNAS
ncbi:hypothetical protein M8C21_025999, partial [Ambrosia artemisiifolia]